MLTYVVGKPPHEMKLMFQDLVAHESFVLPVPHAQPGSIRLPAESFVSECFLQALANGTRNPVPTRSAKHQGGYIGSGWMRFGIMRRLSKSADGTIWSWGRCCVCSNTLKVSCLKTPAIIRREPCIQGTGILRFLLAGHSEGKRGVNLLFLRS